eukprot:COSAG05_NODE_1317_length_5208_cov_54.515365_1_plen_364_part_00
MPQERDPSGRFVKTPGDGAESGPEPEAEPEGPGSLAQLLAAFGEQLRGLEDRQNAARDTDRAALQAELSRVERLAQARPLATDGPPRTGSEAGGFSTPPGSAREARRAGGGAASAVLSGEGATTTTTTAPRASVLRASAAGLAVSTHLSNPAARFRTRALHDFLVACNVHRDGYGVRGKLSRQAIGALEWWSEFGLHRETRRAFWRPPVTVRVASDASMRGGGSVEDACKLSQLPLGQEMGVAACRLWSPAERKLHINHLELKAVEDKLAEVGVCERWAGRSVLWLEDNQTVVGILRNLVTRGRAMYETLEHIMAMLEVHDINLVMRYCESAENPSDWFSRAADKGDWSLAPAVLERFQLLRR